MNLITFHKILISSAIALFLFYAIWELLKYFNTGDLWTIVRSLVSVLASVGFAFYLRTVKSLSTTLPLKGEGLKE